MRQGIGAVGTFNIVIIFVVIVFGLLIGTINYYKAFKTNSRILDIIDKYEGYNQLSSDEINTFLETIGYFTDNSGSNCNQRSHGAELISGAQAYDYCVYYHGNDGTTNDPKGISTYYNYGVITYIYVDLPIIRLLKIPVYTKGERDYKFDESGKNPVAHRG